MPESPENAGSACTVDKRYGVSLTDDLDRWKGINPEKIDLPMDLTLEHGVADHVGLALLAPRSGGHCSLPAFFEVLL
jgi:hypothetical protein